MCNVILRLNDISLLTSIVNQLNQIIHSSHRHCPVNQSINSIIDNQESNPINQSTNQPTNQSSAHCTNQSVNQSNLELLIVIINVMEAIIDQSNI